MLHFYKIKGFQKEDLLHGLIVSWGNFSHRLIMYFLSFFPMMEKVDHLFLGPMGQDILESSQTFTTNQDEECSRVWHLNLVINDDKVKTRSPCWVTKELSSPEGVI